MKTALLADVHANLPVLRRVIDHAKAQGVDEFWNLGDMVGFAPFPNEVVQLLQKTCSRHIRGNYDTKVLSLKHAEKMRKDHKNADKIFSFEWTHHHLSDEAKAFIESLPETLRVVVDGKRILLTHGSPEGCDDGLTLRTTLPRFEELAAKAQADIVLCGHTHGYFSRQAAGTLFVNPGSVGRPFDGDPRASYCVLEISRGKVSVEPHRVDYDLAALEAEMSAYRFPDSLVQTLRLGRSLDDLDSFSGVSEPQVMKAVIDFAEKCHYEKGHARQVASLALKLFDELRELHGYGFRERLLLQVGALLHDIGFVYGVEGHHKASRDMVLRAGALPLSEKERTLVALLARYHRKALPEPGHKLYQDLAPHEQEIVNVLSALLRVADGLDRSHTGVVKDLTVKISEKKILILLQSAGPLEEEIKAAKLKGDLLEKVFGRVLELKASA